MTAESLKLLFERDLIRLKAEIEAYTTEENLWLIESGILNSAGNLCLHLVGNLNAYIGADLANTGYVRNRAEEFSLKNIPKKELVKMIDSTLEIINTSLGNLSDDDLEKDFPTEPLGYKMTTAYFLIHLNGHLNYHLGQINYHRRLLDK